MSSRNRDRSWSLLVEVRLFLQDHWTGGLEFYLRFCESFSRIEFWLGGNISTGDFWGPGGGAVGNNEFKFL